MNQRDVHEAELARTYLKTRPQNVVDNPKQYMDMDSPISPVIMTGLRPTWSDIRLQWRTIIAWVMKKMDCYTCEQQSAGKPREA